MPRPTPAKPAGAPASAVTNGGAVSADVALAHFQELLRAKQERVRQGPMYPPANLYTGRHEVPMESALESVTPEEPFLSTAPDPEAVHGAGVTHVRDSQDLRKPK
jgi:hypothetical protein